MHKIRHFALTQLAQNPPSPENLPELQNEALHARDCIIQGLLAISEMLGDLGAFSAEKNDFQNYPITPETALRLGDLLDINVRMLDFFHSFNHVTNYLEKQQGGDNGTN